MTESPAPALPDHRPAVATTQDWITGLLTRVRPEQLTDPTPCTEFDVAALIRHLYGVADRMEAMGHGRPAASAPSMVDALPEDFVGAYRERTARAQAAWTEESLPRLVTAPFGTLPGAAILGVYLSEHLTHGWDLAVATGQDAEGDPASAATALAVMQRAIAPDNRGDDVPFGPVVESAPDAGPTERLANFLGRSR